MVHTSVCAGQFGGGLASLRVSHKSFFKCLPPGLSDLNRAKPSASLVSRYSAIGDTTVGVKIITGCLVTLENLFPQNYHYRYRLEIRMNKFHYHYRYRLGFRSDPFISIGSQLPS